LKTASNFLPKQKNYELYRKESNAFKNLKELNKQKRSILDLKISDNHLKKENDEEYLTSYSHKFGIKKLLSLKNNAQKELDDNKKDENFVKDFFKSTQKSLK
jgi:hypothetical protein